MTRQILKENNELEKKSIENKIEVIKMLDKADSGHVGGAFSIADILTVLYYNWLKIDPSNPNWEDRDYLLFSNGHVCPIWYVTLADLGFFDKKELNHLREINHLLQGHPTMNIPGVENASGPLGHGISQAIGIALGLKIDGKGNRVVCITSDGEHDEGQNFEAAMSANKYALDNLTVIVDRNHIQIEGTTRYIMPLGNLRDRYESLNWQVIEIDGNNYEQIFAALETADKVNDRPTVIIADTIAGEDVGFMEGSPDFHDWKEDGGVVERAIEELQNQLTKLD